MASNSISPQKFIGLIRTLHDNETAKRSVIPDGQLNAHLKILRQWQSDRLRRTYADFLADPRYKQACLFVLDELYAARDFSQRNRDAEHIYTILSGYLPESALTLLSGSIYLNRLTDELDRNLLGALLNRSAEWEQVSEAHYVRAYIECDNYDQRLTQINLVYALMAEAVQGARSLVFQTGLGLSKAPLIALGWSDLYSFLKRGVQASKRIPDVQLFLGSIHNREMAILDRIFAGVPDPFDL